MARSSCVLAAILFATFAVAMSTLIQKRGIYDDYNGYQHFQPVARLKGPIVVKETPKKDEQDFSKIPGIPGVDFPIYHQVPPTSFSCAHVPYAPGMYANVETGCQAYHICHDGREGHQGASFLCTNGTLFNQHEFACDWWYNVNCADAPSLYNLNLDPNKNPFVPKKPKKEEQPINPSYQSHQAHQAYQTHQPHQAYQTHQPHQTHQSHPGLTIAVY